MNKLNITDNSENNKKFDIEGKKQYKEITFDLFRITLNKINKINSLFEYNNNKKINDLTKKLSNNSININQIKDLSNIIINEFDKIENSIRIIINKPKLNLIYKLKENGKEQIFGRDFVEKNINNIKLIINGKESPLVEYYDLKKGENNVEIKIINKLTDLSNMFYNCKSLKNIEGFESLDIKNIKDLSYIFANCEKLSDIKSLKYWDVSNVENFENMFNSCLSLTDISSLKNWNVSNGKAFNGMFSYCFNISDLSSLKNWNVSNGKDFSGMFYGCSSLSDIESLENWKLKNKYFKIKK